MSLLAHFSRSTFSPTSADSFRRLTLSAVAPVR